MAKKEAERAAKFADTEKKKVSFVPCISYRDL
jgi:hypothetical protein